MALSIRQLHLINFKCFHDHTIYFDPTTIMIGQNNAGKTAVVEALRILGLACARFRTVKTYASRPEWLFNLVNASVRGIHVSAKAIDTDLEQIFTDYGNPPAMIEALFTEDIVIRIYINSETDIFSAFYHQGVNLHTFKGVLERGVPKVCVLPQIVPLTKDESLVMKETLQRNQFSKRISGNFRNTLLVAKGSANYRNLQESIEKTWGSVQINSLEKSEDGKTVLLNMRDKDYVSEIYYMGHGIQMWLQTLWFVVSAEPDAIIVLDEPDVYMHADLQRKLVRLLKGNYAQTIIATHSIEIMSEVLPENILIINRKNPNSFLAKDYPVLQTAISGMGSIHNINLSRILNHKRYLYVEGDDIDILKILYDKVFPNQTEPLDHFPSVSTGGWGSWDVQMQNAQRLLKDMPELKVYFIYDRDYHPDEDIEKRKEEANRHRIPLHIWERKELENYVIVPNAIARVIMKKHPEFDRMEILCDLQKELREICDDLKEEVIDKRSDELFHKNKRSEPSSIRKEVQKHIDAQWQDLNFALKLVPGKTVVSKLSEFSQKRYKVSFGASQIASAMLREEVDPEVQQLLAMIKGKN